MDVSQTIQPNSEQINAEDLIGGPVTVTITGVEKGTADQPVFIHLAEFPGRTFRPAKTVRRLIVAAWGPDSSDYIGRRLTIYNEPTVKWAGKEIGGVRVSHMSHIDAPLRPMLAVARGQRTQYTVNPLQTTAQRDWLAALAETEGDVDLIGALGKAAKQAGAPKTVVDSIRDAYKEAKAASGDTAQAPAEQSAQPDMPAAEPAPESEPVDAEVVEPDEGDEPDWVVAEREEAAAFFRQQGEEQGR